MSKRHRRGISEIVGATILLLIISISLLTISSSLIKIERTIDETSKIASLRLAESTNPPDLIVLDEGNGTVLMKLEGGYISGISQIIYITNGKYNILHTNNNSVIKIPVSNSCDIEKLILITKLGNAIYYDNICDRHQPSTPQPPIGSQNNIIVGDIINMNKTILNSQIIESKIINLRTNITLGATIRVIDFTDRIRIDYTIGNTTLTIVEYKNNVFNKIWKGSDIKLNLNNISISIIPFIIKKVNNIYIGYATVENNINNIIYIDGRISSKKSYYLLYKNGVVSLEYIHAGPYVMSNIVWGTVNITKELATDNTGSVNRIMISGSVDVRYNGYYIILEKIQLKGEVIYSNFDGNEYNITIENISLSKINVNTNISVNNMKTVIYNVKEVEYINRPCSYVNYIEKDIESIVNTIDMNATITIKYDNNTYVRDIVAEKRIFSLKNLVNSTITISVNSYNLIPTITTMRIFTNYSENIINYYIRYELYPCKAKYWYIELSIGNNFIRIPYTTMINNIKINGSYSILKSIMLEELDLALANIDYDTIIVYRLQNDISTIVDSNIIYNVVDTREPGFYLVLALKGASMILPVFIVIS